MSKGKECIRHATVRQCHYCENYFAKTEENMKKHFEVCAAKEGITYSFDNGNIISFQDNFRYQSGLPFIVYFDFETTTGDSEFFDPKMYIVSYRQISTFHPGLNLDQIVIFRSLQQNAEEIYDLSHLKKKQVPFFNHNFLSAKG